MTHDNPLETATAQVESVLCGEVRAPQVRGFFDELHRDTHAARRYPVDAEAHLPALQVNIPGGHLPERKDIGVRYPKLPIDQL